MSRSFGFSKVKFALPHVHFCYRESRGDHRSSAQNDRLVLIRTTHPTLRGPPSLVKGTTPLALRVEFALPTSRVTNAPRVGSAGLCIFCRDRRPRLSIIKNIQIK